MGHWLGWGVFPSEPLTAADAAVFETFVVPRYLRLFGELVAGMILPTDGARIVSLGCRTGFPDTDIAQAVGASLFVGVDASSAALEVGKAKCASVPSIEFEYLEADELPSLLEDEGYSHTFSLHPTLAVGERQDLFAEMARLLYGGGQALIALPLRGSFQEIGDLFREYALKHDDGDFGKLVEDVMARRPTIETLEEELENVGLEDVDVEIRQTTLSFDSGRALLEDPICRLLIVPELRACLGMGDLRRPLDYLREAVDKYWSEGSFELTVNVGCASARRVER